MLNCWKENTWFPQRHFCIPCCLLHALVSRPTHLFPLFSFALNQQRAADWHTFWPSFAPEVCCTSPELKNTKKEQELFKNRAETMSQQRPMAVKEQSSWSVSEKWYFVLPGRQWDSLSMVEAMFLCCTRHWLSSSMELMSCEDETEREREQ